jgi:thioredoxin-related protein
MGMKKLGFTLIAALALAQGAMAAEGTWLSDLAKAQSQAKQEKKLVLMDFTGSDWCPPCKALHREILTSQEFVDYAKDNLVLVIVDFPNGKKLPADQQKANDQLAKKYQIQGFPTVIVLDGAGKELSKDVGYNAGTVSPKEYVAKLQKLKKD